MVRRQGNQTKKDKEKRRGERRSEKKKRAQTIREEKRERREDTHVYIYERKGWHIRRCDTTT